MTTTPEAALKLVYKPEQHDDWGTIRTETGEFFAKIWFPRTHTNEELAEHRKNGTDPYEAAARLVVDAVNRTPAPTDEAKKSALEDLDEGFLMWANGETYALNCTTIITIRALLAVAPTKSVRVEDK